ncbi:dynein light intermediate chain [Nannochloropsis gaditana]|uniref:Dynein light intermediate chain n=1 Tax=Nannochloropsis gaditana TaxID=72520 RepID=W7U234_9STRA|nr:dynein light intermediate chain [Nannochloropsis gaditana]
MSAGENAGVAQRETELIWGPLLAEAARSEQSNFTPGTILFLGDAAVGKTRLIDRFITSYDALERQAAATGRNFIAEEEKEDEEGQEGSGALSSHDHSLLSYAFFPAIDPVGCKAGGQSWDNGTVGRSSDCLPGRCPAGASKGLAEDDQDAGVDENEMDAGARVNVWSLSDPALKDLLHVALDDPGVRRRAASIRSEVPTDPRFDTSSLNSKSTPAQTLQRTICMIAIDLTRPWACESALERWVGVLRSVLGEKARAGCHKGEEEGEEERVRKARLVAYLSRCYQGEDMDRVWLERGELKEEDEGGGLEEPKVVFRINRMESSGGRPLSSPQPARSTPLPAGVLEENLGVPLVVVGLKADLAPVPDSYDDGLRSLFFQQYLRRVCLKYGASLVYTSASNGDNCLLLQRYLLHRLYPEHFSFLLPVQAPRALTFVPSGWDTPELVQKLLSPQAVPWPPSLTFSEIFVPPKGARAYLDRGDGGAEVCSETWEQESSERHTEITPTQAWLERLWEQQQQQRQRCPQNLGDGDCGRTMAGEADGSAGNHDAGGLREGPMGSTGKGRSTRYGNSNRSIGEANQRSEPYNAGGGADKAEIRNFFEGLLAGGGKK